MLNGFFPDKRGVLLKKVSLDEIESAYSVYTWCKYKGDIKLFSTIGAIMGWKFIIHSMAISILLGGFIAVIIIVLRKNALERLKHLFNYLKYCLITIKVHEYQELDKNDKGLFRFSYAVAGGTIITLVFYDNLRMF